jgi:hypothetical protein
MSTLQNITFKNVTYTLNIMTFPHREILDEVALLVQ